ncbi:hypothetical protein K493DRAFT_304418 [Basidiobolus meristosporus CBS 931.73]|uniref:Uncharacterized protein n=1 Tax=Basidiobolus meristosporus CBS 931.73 TaxID=1314790 RepID=A0A1Y1XZB9_9FUNG|nr:hypothetical protein K493DRAFT_304418 [Basidiobolus meristosporus CBS 931.73]|eukprot:ORX90995.1 hypothetical protein K493DRAFT_304418 [Basidiobolus meristosporus CBS 931.73]
MPSDEKHSSVLRTPSPAMGFHSRPAAPESRFDPGTLEYEVTANFLRSSSIAYKSTPVSSTYRASAFPQPIITLQPPSARHSDDFEIEITPVVQAPTKIPLGGVLFLLGFLFFPCWWLGSIYPKRPQSKLETRWRLYNRMISVISLLILGFTLGVISWYLSRR